MVRVQSAVDRVLRETFPQVTFTGIWVRSRPSGYGDEILDIWAVYEGNAGQLQSPERPYLLPRLVDTLQALGVTAAPVTRFISRDDVGDWQPEGT